MLHNETLNAILLNIIPLNTIQLSDHKKMCSSCTKYIVLFFIFLIINTSISCVFIYFHWLFKKSSIPVRFNPNIQTTIY